MKYYSQHNKLLYVTLCVYILIYLKKIILNQNTAKNSGSIIYFLTYKNNSQHLCIIQK